MSFREHDKKTFIADTARDFAARRISKRDFLRKMGMAGVGFSAFSRGPARQHAAVPRRPSLIGTRGRWRRRREMTKWLKDVGGQFKGTKIRYTSEATPPTVVLNQIKKRVHRADRHRSRNRDRAARAGSRQGDAGRPGPARHL